MSGPDAPGADDGTRGTPRVLAAAVRLVGRAAPAGLTAWLLLALTASAVPVAAAWILRGVLDRLVATVGTGAGAGASSGSASGSGPGAFTTLALLLVACGVTVAVVPQLLQYLQAQLRRAVGLRAQLELHTAVDRFVGLSRLEDPRFLDRLRLAQQFGGSAPVDVAGSGIGLVGALVTLTGFLGTLALLGPWTAVAVLASGLPVLCAELALSRRRAELTWTVGPAERRELFYAALLTNLQAAKEIRLFGVGRHLRERMITERRTADAARQRLDRQELGVQAGLALLSAVAAGAGLLWAVAAAGSGRIGLGDVTVLVAALPAVQGALAALALELARAHQSALMFRHFISVTGAPADLPAPAQPRPVPPLRDAVELRDVWFRYGDRQPWILRGVDLVIPAGRSVGLAGLNGAGKSTLVKLLCRFYDPTRGQILWDGVDLRELCPRELRRRLGATFQDYMEYDLTARENIALGDLTALTDPGRRVEQAAELAGVHDKLTGLPHGYDTLLSRIFFSEQDKEDAGTGLVLSGGQWQRLALARSLVRSDADLLILDEPSSGLDPEAEHSVHQRLRDHRAGRAGLLISHRLSALREADTIAVLEDGRITETGPHRELVRRGGSYARLFALQAGGYGAAEETGGDAAVPSAAGASADAGTGRDGWT
ncbi:multidrug ABC transporter permease [Kitasatospora herbaricolor]|uniref:ABC transporter ATP-binding protein n=1 Tax=Kitasatospora herbaricolor TaxID=68217 RepID=UPI00174B9015|nr:ABC transporter ATP-binding protein [Kitasatospora herbaricolor]MDQ0313298.1 ATP-binding cassette subfamily B protein [Kitasatospora herbaricolor]GGV19929.1 multidrug ABC transporter permease [Kitasatospora herbaricolor]